jgi:UDP-N-acetylmuramoyl-tripeptide--D-alanyl-D-alanine ligase
VSVARFVGESVVVVALAAAFAAQTLRWLRVLQREHYLTGSVSRFYARWSRAESIGPSARRQGAPGLVLPLWVPTLLVVALCFVAGQPVAGAAGASLYGLFFPARLTVAGRSSRLRWTRRLTVVAVTAVTIAAATWVGLLWWDVAWGVAALDVLLAFAIVDVAAAITAPIERRVAERYVARARQRLDRVRPLIVAITGSYGKTSTKHHLAELLGGRHGVLPTPRSFNNRAGLSRAINENLSESTTIFIAEMGVYGPGELRDMCEWCPPSIAIVTAIGPVHLERMRTLDVVERAKFEITERAGTVVLNGDDPRLVTWVGPLKAAGKVVRTAGTGEANDVRVELAAERWRISVDGELVDVAAPVAGVRETNLALALAAALVIGVPAPELVGRLAHLTSVPNRMVVASAPSGVTVVDDTFNANPASAASSVATLAALPVGGRRVVVTPGMVELGPIQREENERLGAEARSAGAEMVVVGRTNAAALARGFGDGARRESTREDAVAWVRSSLHGDDAVLYLNDLPDHYP